MNLSSPIYSYSRLSTRWLFLCIWDFGRSCDQKESGSSGAHREFVVGSVCCGDHCKMPNGFISHRTKLITGYKNRWKYAISTAFVGMMVKFMTLVFQKWPIWAAHPSDLNLWSTPTRQQALGLFFAMLLMSNSPLLRIFILSRGSGWLQRYMQQHRVTGRLPLARPHRLSVLMLRCDS